LTAEKEDHPMGEVAFVEKALVTAVDQAMQEQVQAAEELRLTTPGGRFQVRWDEEGSATALGQLAFFAEFLYISGLFARWVEGCPRRGPTHKKRLSYGVMTEGYLSLSRRSLTYRELWDGLGRPLLSSTPLTHDILSKPYELDSGLRRNDGCWYRQNFFTAS
jgi:hypothetical protein